MLHCGFISGNFLEFDDGKLPVFVYKGHNQFICCAVLSLGGHERRCARRIFRPAWTRLVARFHIGGCNIFINLNGRCAVEGLMGTVAIIMVDYLCQFRSHLIGIQWDFHAAQIVLFEGSDESFDHGDTAIFADNAAADC